MCTVSAPSTAYKENSRRFRALPLYVSFLSRGRDGFRSLIQTQVEVAATVEQWMRTEAAGKLEVLTPAADPLPAPKAPAPASASAMSQDHAAGPMPGPDALCCPKPWTGRWGTTVVLFRPCAPRGNDPAKGAPEGPHQHHHGFPGGAPGLAAAINATRKMYVTNTSYASAPAIRLAVSNWSTGPREAQEVIQILKQVLGM